MIMKFKQLPSTYTITPFLFMRVRVRVKGYQIVTLKSLKVEFIHVELLRIEGEKQISS